MNTGDSMYITPFTPHTFTTRKGSGESGLILALTYGNNLVGDAKNELSALGAELGSSFVLDFTQKETASSSLLKFHIKNASLSSDELSRRTGIDLSKIISFEEAKSIPSFSELESIAKALRINVRDLLPYDTKEDKVVIQFYNDSKRWNYPESSKAYNVIELASTTALPFSKAFEFNILSEDNTELDLQTGLHQYGYNVGEGDFKLNWKYNDEFHSEVIKPGDSFYIKPFIPHNFREKGKVLILRVGGKVAGDPQRELSFIGKENVNRAISENIQWFDPKGKS